jgi:LAO/AO transport system kinase
VSVKEIVAGARLGRPRDVARMLTMIENEPQSAASVRRELVHGESQLSATIIGITGPPGVGKSTTTSALIGAYRQHGMRVAVLAVDPSSPFSGGALLGDRIRMQDHATDEGVYIRSMAARGHLGGLAAAVPAAMDALVGCGFDRVIVETVGVGQSEIDIASLADTVLVLMAPGMGDGIQAAKAGILEIGDIFAVNKADRDGADATVRELRAMIQLGMWSGWTPPVLKVSATTGVGIDEMLTAIDEHEAWLDTSGQRQVRRRARIRTEIAAYIHTSVAASLQGPAVDQVCDEVLAGELDAMAAASHILRRFLEAKGQP